MRLCFAILLLAIPKPQPQLQQLYQLPDIAVICERNYREASAHLQKIDAAYYLCPSWALTQSRRLASQHCEFWLDLWFSYDTTMGIDNDYYRQRAIEIYGIEAVTYPLMVPPIPWGHIRSD